MMNRPGRTSPAQRLSNDLHAIVSRSGNPRRIEATDLIQLAKATAAAVIAWIIAADLLDLKQPFLAPWVALLTVHATVYRTVTRGAQAIAATGAGVLLAFVIDLALGSGAVAIGVAVLIGLGIAKIGLLRTEGVTVATTAVLVIATASQSATPFMLLQRMIDTGIGVAVGLLINLIILPPLNNRSAQQRIDDVNRELGSLLVAMAAQLRSDDSEERAASWVERTRQIDDQLAEAWQLVRFADESSRLNPRYRLSRHTTTPRNLRSVLLRLEEGIAHTRSIARIVDEATRGAHDWAPEFREPWLNLLSETGRRIADPDAELTELPHRVDELTNTLSSQALPCLLWPTYGALISTLRNVIVIVDDIASSRPARG